LTVGPYTIPWNTIGVANGSHTLGARTRDAAGNTATAAPVIVTVLNDVTPPVVSLTSPNSGSTIAGSITLSATSTDDVGVVGVQFLLDGAAIGAQQATGPYSLSWDSTTVANGAHTLGAVARD